MAHVLQGIAGPEKRHKSTYQREAPGSVDGGRGREAIFCEVHMYRYPRRLHPPRSYYLVLHRLALVAMLATENFSPRPQVSKSRNRNKRYVLISSSHFLSREVVFPNSLAANFVSQYSAKRNQYKNHLRNSGQKTPGQLTSVCKLLLERYDRQLVP